jgi:hypothetical protein
MVAINSTLPEGEKKPIAFVRRRLDPAMAVAMGLNVEAAAQRAYLAVPAPVIDGSSYNMLAYAVAGYESVIFAILNPKAIVKSADCSALY